MEKGVLGTDSICWNITNICNMNCDFCFRDIFGADLSIEDNIKILKSLKERDIKKITFTGGEALLYKKGESGFLKILKKAYDMGFECRLITNGSNFYESYEYKDTAIQMFNQEYRLDDILPYLKRLTFSCDRASKYENDEIGRSLNNDSGFDSTKCISYLINEIRKKYPKDKLEIDINSVALRDINGNYYYLDEMQDLIYSNKGNINKWKILIFYGLRGKALEKKDLYSIPKEEVKLIKATYSLNNPDLTVSIKDNDDMDNNLILTNNGILKKSLKGKEYDVVDLKNVINKDEEIEYVHVGVHNSGKSHRLYDRFNNKKRIIKSLRKINLPGKGKKNRGEDCV